MTMAAVMGLSDLQELAIGSGGIDPFPEKQIDGPLAIARSA